MEKASPRNPCRGFRPLICDCPKDRFFLRRCCKTSYQIIPFFCPFFTLRTAVCLSCVCSRRHAAVPFRCLLSFLRLVPRLSPLSQSCMYRAASSANAAARRACRYGLLLPQLLQKFPLLTVPQLQVQPPAVPPCGGCAPILPCGGCPPPCWFCAI